jgi:hypothetical protein
MINLKNVMKTAWNLFRKYADHGYSFSLCLKMAWRMVRDGVRYVFEVSTNQGRFYGFAMDADECQRAKIEMTNAFVARKRLGEALAIYGNSSHQLLV